jgi:hypothetical protein
MMLGDGHIDIFGNPRAYYTKSKQLADDFQELSLKAGYITTLSNVKNRDCYVVTIGKDRTAPRTGSKYVEKILYNGPIWCVSVDNQIVYVRRNGKPSWQGNSYWWVDANENGLESWWKWHAGRFTEMDKVFNAYGLYPKYMLGEIGAVGTTDKGYTLLHNSGWQNYMHIGQYISQLKTFKALIDKWNSANNNRCQGGTIFTLCTWDWKTFTMSAGDIDKLRTAL